jgi:hypothetical protein
MGQDRWIRLFESEVREFRNRDGLTPKFADDNTLLCVENARHLAVVDPKSGDKLESIDLG